MGHVFTRVRNETNFQMFDNVMNYEERFKITSLLILRWITIVAWGMFSGLRQELKAKFASTR